MNAKCQYLNPDSGLVKSIGSSIISGSFIQALDSEEGSRAPVCINVVETMGGSCLRGVVICDCRGKGLFIGGVGGALLRANGSVKGNAFVVGVPLYDEGDGVWPCSESELIDVRLRDNGAPRSNNLCCMRLQSSSNPS